MPKNITRRNFNRNVGLFTSLLMTSSGKAFGESKSLSIINPLRKKPFDLKTFMRYGVEHIYNGAIDKRYNYMPFVRFYLTDNPTNAVHISWGCPHMIGRFADALAAVYPIIKFESDENADRACHRILYWILGRGNWREREG